MYFGKIVLTFLCSAVSGFDHNLVDIESLESNSGNLDAPVGSTTVQFVFDRRGGRKTNVGVKQGKAGPVGLIERLRDLGEWISVDLGRIYNRASPEMTGIIVDAFKNKQELEALEQRNKTEKTTHVLEWFCNFWSHWVTAALTDQIRRSLQVKFRQVTPSPDAGDALRPQSAQYCNIPSTRSGQIWPSFPQNSHFWSLRA
ncbi:hypothetical protein SERLA73DRAFT_159795 [Serpula lacrymans var. lacrymans S7.3]|uniref:Uncharacterized protein n=1 Tax=Serpula lacrymans var. lacrymans (strain S7.3) TaxID=936435 RepID=F8PVH4_SERL3|nr:hypothetical protein SERLA73DRAFT_159795 [Serpula lacrymans var. lacrymans S7.3]